MEPALILRMVFLFLCGFDLGICVCSLVSWAGASWKQGKKSKRPRQWPRR